MTRFVSSVFLLVFACRNLECQSPELTVIDPFRKLARGPGYEELGISIPDRDRPKTQPRWLLVAGRRVVPGSVYRLIFENIRRLGTFDEDLPLTVRAAITHDHEQMAFGKVLVQPGDISEVLLKIPDTSVDGLWQLKVEGREGRTQTMVFRNTTTITYSPTFLTILIQTSRPVYRANQKARFRVVMLTKDLKPYEGPIDSYVIDSQGRIIRRWPSRHAGDGLVNLEFHVTKFPALGNWTIQVRVRQQVENKTIIVEKYFRPRLEVFVRLPQSFRAGDDAIAGVVVANMTNWRDVRGNCTVQLQLARNSARPVPSDFETIYTDRVSDFRGSLPFSMPMFVVAGRVGSQKEDVIVRVLASVTESFGAFTQHGWALARIIHEKAKIKFLGDKPLFFIPGMPISIHALASYEDDHPFEEEELENAAITVTFVATTSKVVSITGSDLVAKGGVAMTSFDVPDDARSLEISASFISSRGLRATASLSGLPIHSPNKRYIQIETSTFDVKPGENIVFHVRNNFFSPFFNYVVVSSGQIVHSGREVVCDVSVPSLTTFSLPASTEMAPLAKVLVWIVDQNQEVVSHLVAVPVDPLGRHEVSLKWNEHKDHTGGSAEVTFIGEPGALFAAGALWEETHMMDSGCDIDRTRVLLHMMGFNEDVRHREEGNFSVKDLDEIRHGAIPHIKRATTKSREGYGSNVKFFPTTMAGPDSPTMFNFSEVILLTDALLYYHPGKATGASTCDTNHTSLLYCLTGGCYSVEERCNGVPNCPDSSDEIGCPVLIDPLRTFRLYRESRLHRFYDPSPDGDWAWKQERRVGREIRVFSIPKRPQRWAFTFFAMGKKLGLGILEEKVEFDSSGPFMLKAEGPKVARRWEQVGITVGIFNFHSSVVGILITVPQSPDFQTIVVEDKGVVDSYSPRHREGTFQHVVWLPGGTSTDVHIPVIFTRLGKIFITIEGATQMQKDSDTVIIDVIPEAASISMHTSILLDLKDRALVYEFMDIPLDESPIVPYTIKRKYVFDTPMGSVSLSGDIVGPAFPELPVNEENLLGFVVMGAETSIFSFASNIWSLHYLRLTNQITEQITYQVLEKANVFYAEVSRYQMNSGGFSNWISAEESVWLTAHILKNLWIASFQDWENYVFIDHTIIQRGVEFILSYQTELGSFQETPTYHNPLNPTADPRLQSAKYQNVSLTAHVVIAIQSVMAGLKGKLHSQADLAKQRAVRYLEHRLNGLTDPYELAVSAWALIQANSEFKEEAYGLLDRIKRVSGDRVYWSREPIVFNKVVYEDSQRPYLQPKIDNRWDAHSVEATSYALLVYIKREGIGIIQEKIVRFLASMREMDNGLIASVDSLAAKEALVEYSYRARIRDITDMSVYIEQSAYPNSTLTVNLRSTQNLTDLQISPLYGVYGHVSVVGRGSGQALFQLNYQYGVDTEDELEVPPVPSFNWEISAHYTGFNNSRITITSCQSWINTDEAETSGATVVDIPLPSGYHIVQDELVRISVSRQVRNLRWAFVSATSVKFFFNKLDAFPVCFNYTLDRWFPVSNNTRFSAARIYELYQPEKFKMKLFEMFPLYSLDICEVCGSYQCPYCPFYSASARLSPAISAILVTSMCILKLN